MSDIQRLPKHVAIIMDGNGRWAQQRALDRYEGHREGVVSVRKVVEAAVEIGVKYLTLYTFSTENWNRPQAEVDALMELVVIAVQRETEDLMKNGVSLRVIGDLSRLPQRTRDNLQDCIDKTAGNTALVLTLALSYSSRWEIANAAKMMATEVQQGRLTLDEITKENFPDYLCTKQMPDPDLLIRTGGEQRISNYLLWQLAYAELYFTDIYWPDFRADRFKEAIADFQTRERRFGKTSEQIENVNNCK
ncbi:di-trans,poly-cis-decaprenylcistransferase [Candidatus Symbiothrix dinenymphae]|nr:di-trans,poly-cis-decaprenylcistransferase [Candidatus Symbiothrix dinenymphae]